MKKPELPWLAMFNMSFGFFGIQIGFAIQNSNMSRIFQTFGADMNTIALLWIAGPVTGLLVQPIIGYMSDNTWIRFGTRFGRRRPYFLVGAVLTTLALLVMPNSPYLWFAASTLWILDASLNITMEPFRAFVADNLPKFQRTAGFAIQTILIGIGGFFGSIAPWAFHHFLGVSNEAPLSQIPDNVVYAFYLGAAAIFATVLWTIFTSKEYSPEELEAFEEEEQTINAQSDDDGERVVKSGNFVSLGLLFVVAGVIFAVLTYHFGLDKQLYVFSGAALFFGACFLINALLISVDKINHIFSKIQLDLVNMPTPMKQLAVVQFFSWIGLFVMWIYTTPAITAFHFDALPGAPDYQKGSDWVGVMFGVYNLVAAAYAFAIPPIASKFGLKATHAMSLFAGALGLFSYYVIADPNLLILSMVGIGIAWGAILSLPYAMLSSFLPAKKMGTYMGIFNFFIVIPQLITAAAIGPILTGIFDGQAIFAILLGGCAFVIAAIAVLVIVRTPEGTDNETSV